MKFLSFIVISLSSIGFTYSQEIDTAFEQLDSIIAKAQLDSLNANDEVEYPEIIYSAPPDSSAIEKKSFDNESVQKLKEDPEMNYKQPPTAAESLWDRFWMWIAQIFEDMFSTAVGTDWGRLIVYAIGLVLLVVLIMLILKVNAFKVLYSGDGTAKKYQVLDENIHEMDFEELIQEAMDQQDYRRGIRLLFLYALKLLSDKHLIHWESGKTNHDYVGELEKKELKTGLNELSFYFDYAWYGNFQINRDTFNKAQNTFTDWKGKIN